MAHSLSSMPLTSSFPSSHPQSTKTVRNSRNLNSPQIPVPAVSVLNRKLCKSMVMVSDFGGSSSSSARDRCQLTLCMATKMKRSFKPIGGGVAAPEKPEVKDDDPPTSTGGGGGDIGKINITGGGDRGDDGGDDDDYLGDFDEEDDGDEGGFFRRRMVNQEIFKSEIIESVLQEWYKTITDLPEGLLEACEMGRVSSAQIVRYLSMNARPSFARFMSRNLPEYFSREFVGRMIADPLFLRKMVFEQVMTICYSGWWEISHRQERIKQEWHFALLNVLTTSACNLALVWTLAPSCSFGSTFQSDLQNTIRKLPNNIFEKNYPHRGFDLVKRSQCFVWKTAQACLFGMVAGAANTALTNIMSLKERTSILMPSVKKTALISGTVLGFSGNLRYQLINGLERLLSESLDPLGAVILSSAVLRALNIKLGETVRLASLGLEVDPTIYYRNAFKTHTRQMPEAQNSSSSRTTTPKEIFSGLFRGREDAGNAKKAAESSKVQKRKRVKRKVVAQ